MNWAGKFDMFDWQIMAFALLVVWVYRWLWEDD
jgi:F0F1-type ATP synthase membrane subunit b/b'